MEIKYLYKFYLLCFAAFFFVYRSNVFGQNELFIEVDSIVISNKNEKLLEVHITYTNNSNDFISFSDIFDLNLNSLDIDTVNLKNYAFFDIFGNNKFHYNEFKLQNLEIIHHDNLYFKNKESGKLNDSILNDKIFQYKMKKISLPPYSSKEFFFLIPKIDLDRIIFKYGLKNIGFRFCFKFKNYKYDKFFKDLWGNYSTVNGSTHRKLEGRVPVKYTLDKYFFYFDLNYFHLGRKK
jgi:hypothetical protein